MKWIERYEPWFHVLGWLAFISLPILTLPTFLWNPTDLLSLGMAQLLTSLLTIGYFYYTLHWLMPRLLELGEVRRFWLTMTFMLMSVVAVKVASFYVFPPGQHQNGPPPPSLPGRPEQRQNPPRPGPHSPWPGTTGTIVSFGMAMLVASLIAVVRHNSRNEEARQQIALEKVSTELAMLKLQVSPHFLFNTLNNIRWLARKKSDQTEVAVVSLAQLLRYMIYQARQDQVPLRQEVEQVRNYIDLQKMRLTERHPVAFTVEGDIDAHQIEPLLFIPFVENAFKYGSAVAEGGPITIRLAVTDDSLLFETENPTAFVAAPSNADESGIGIENVRKRLTLHYPDQHSLATDRIDGQFYVRLLIHFQHEQTALHRY